MGRLGHIFACTWILLAFFAFSQIEASCRLFQSPLPAEKTTRTPTHLNPRAALIFEFSELAQEELSEETVTHYFSLILNQPARFRFSKPDSYRLADQLMLVDFSDWTFESIGLVSRLATISRLHLRTREGRHVFPKIADVLANRILDPDLTTLPVELKDPSLFSSVLKTFSMARQGLEAAHRLIELGRKILQENRFFARASWAALSQFATATANLGIRNRLWANYIAARVETALHTQNANVDDLIAMTRNACMIGRRAPNDDLLFDRVSFIAETLLKRGPDEFRDFSLTSLGTIVDFLSLKDRSIRVPRPMRRAIQRSRDSNRATSSAPHESASFLLKVLGIKHINEFQIGSYYADILIDPKLTNDRPVIIEIMGFSHFIDGELNGATRFRNFVLSQQGYTVIGVSLGSFPLPNFKETQGIFRSSTSTPDLQRRQILNLLELVPDSFDFAKLRRKLQDGLNRRRSSAAG